MKALITKDTNSTSFGMVFSETFVSFAPSRLCRNAKGFNLVISNEVRDLAFSATYEKKISRLWLEMTIPTQSVRGEKKTY
jgi:hypothetical protein